MGSLGNWARREPINSVAAFGFKTPAMSCERINRDTLLVEQILRRGRTISLGKTNKQKERKREKNKRKKEEKQKDLYSPKLKATSYTGNNLSMLFH